MIALAEEHELWEAYFADRSVANRNLLAEHYDAWAMEAVDRVLRKLPGPVDADALRQEARMAMLRAIARYHGGTKFTTFSASRLRGAVIDALRAMDHVPRTVRSRRAERKRLEAAGVDAQAAMSPRAYQESFIRTRRSMDEEVFDAKQGGWYQLRDLLSLPAFITQLETDDSFRDLCRSCSLEEQTLLYLYYVKEATMRQIAGVLHLSESRISQIHTEIITRLRQRRERRSVSPKERS